MEWSEGSLRAPIEGGEQMVKMSHRTGGQILVDQLIAQGVDRLTCVPGESYLAVLDALYDASIDVLVCRNEGGAAMMEQYGAAFRISARRLLVLLRRGRRLPAKPSRTADDRRRLRTERSPTRRATRRGINVPAGPSLPRLLDIARTARAAAGRDPETFLVTTSGSPTDARLAAWASTV